MAVLPLALWCAMHAIANRSLRYEMAPSFAYLCRVDGARLHCSTIAVATTGADTAVT